MKHWIMCILKIVFCLLLLEPSSIFLQAHAITTVYYKGVAVTYNQEWEEIRPYILSVAINRYGDTAVLTVLDGDYLVSVFDRNGELIHQANVTIANSVHGFPLLVFIDRSTIYLYCTLDTYFEKNSYDKVLLKIVPSEGAEVRILESDSDLHTVFDDLEIIEGSRMLCSQPTTAEYRIARYGSKEVYIENSITGDRVEIIRFPYSFFDKHVTEMRILAIILKPIGFGLFIFVILRLLKSGKR